MLRTDVPFSHIHTPQYVATRNSGRSGKSGAAGHFYDTLLELDETVGSIMAALAENKLDENTLVLVTGDNGPCECSNGRLGCRCCCDLTVDRGCEQGRSSAT